MLRQKVIPLHWIHTMYNIFTDYIQKGLLSQITTAIWILTAAQTGYELGLLLQCIYIEFFDIFRIQVG
jgi:hypothetical protein